MQVIEDGAAHIALLHERLPPVGGDPYRYSALLRMSIEPDQVRISLGVTNTGDATLPFGIGLHPWLPRSDDTRVTLSALGALALDERYRARGLDAWPEGGPLAAAQTLPSGAELAISAIAWAGEARFASHMLGLGLAVNASETLRHPVLWTPPGADFVCFEPQSHSLGAPSEAAARAITPLAQLAPGETLSGWMTLRPYELAPLMP